MIKERLFTPGPTTVPPEILTAMNISALHHRTDAFKKILRSAADGSRRLLGGERDPIFLACSGTGAMEATIRNLCALGDTIISVDAGAFGARWKKIATCCGVKCQEISCEWGSSPTLEQVRDAISRNPEAKIFCIQHCETSTTVLHPIERIAALVRDVAPSMLFVVDGISAFMTAPLPAQRDLIDVYIVGSQKGLMLPPGLSFVDLSARAWAIAENTPRSTLYFDFLTERDALARNTSAWTPATTLIAGLVEAIAMLEREGVSKVFNRHDRLARATRQAGKALGLTVMAPDHPSPGVTGFYPPNGMSADEIRSTLKKTFGIRIAGGQGKLEGQVIRIGHMGYVDDVDIVGLVGALEQSLEALGHPVERGAGVAEALLALREDAA